MDHGWSKKIFSLLKKYPTLTLYSTTAILECSFSVHKTVLINTAYKILFFFTNQIHV